MRFQAGLVPHLESLTCDPPKREVIRVPLVVTALYLLEEPEDDVG